MIDFQDPQPIFPQQHEKAARTLAGKRVVITRAAHQSAELADLLQQRGAEPILYPCIAIAAPEDTAALDTALKGVANGAFDWLVLTSANTVEALRLRCQALGLSLRGMRTAAVGPATADAARDALGVEVQLVPEEYEANALAAALHVQPGTRVFLPQADIARSTLRDQLSAAGADVTVIAAYRTVMGRGGVNVDTLLKADALTFTSSSTVENCAARVRAESESGKFYANNPHLRPLSLRVRGESQNFRAYRVYQTTFQKRSEGSAVNQLLAIPAFCIGPQTAHTARKCGFGTVITAAVYTLDGLVEALAGYFGR